MRCPKCANKLENKVKKYKKNFFICPSGDGVLIAASHLVQKDQEIIDEINEFKKTHLKESQEKEVTCPHCYKKMHKVDYNFTGITIDSCINCHYRWLDSGELNQIKNYKPKQLKNPEDMFLLVDLRSIIKDGSTIDEEANKRSPIYTTATGGIIRGWGAGDSRRTLGILSGTALYGIISGMLKSKVLRILIPITLVIIGLVFWYVTTEWNNF